ncbi:MAG: L-glutamate gamma-semialdehyde dehydrogenase [Deltaproteobacteria bacterium]|nr:L-glutamate gamma-semialdehyde dehydrogenase [Deltaproteobacteria bacterium]MCW5805647.1 L-glutamate gamma-semialdehyde dehydrogenase [Deltaproteobacteria bacterium]
MHDAIVSVPDPVNEPVLGYAPGSPEKRALKAALAAIEKEVVEIPCVVGGQRIHTGQIREVTMPHRHRHVVARFHAATDDVAERAILAALDARREWAAMRWESRAAILLRAAELLATTWRARMNAATMHGQSKTAHQAEIDAACEMIDFFRFNAAFAQDLYRMQPRSSSGVWNAMELRPLEGFVFALTPFNFTAIAGNLPSAPALMGNTVVWKPAEVQLLAAWEVFRLFEEAGFPPGVINFIPGLPHGSTNVLLDHPALAGVHFTGSTEVFRGMWKRVAENIDRYKTYPRLVGETGGKDFILAHPSADPRAVATAIVRGGFEYQGQKCSAASRAYIARSVWESMKDELVDTIGQLKVGDVSDFSNFMGAVIKQGAFEKHQRAIAEAREAPGMRVVAGGGCDNREGWFVQPTLITTDDPMVRHMREEFFGPIVTLHVYPDEAWGETLQLVDRTSPYALTGAIFARDRAAIVEASSALRDAAGNFYINDKPTGAVVGQQPFGGARASGTDDKAGSPLNLLRFVAPRTIKETFVPPTDYRYAFLDEP